MDGSVLSFLLAKRQRGSDAGAGDGINKQLRNRRNATIRRSSPLLRVNWFHRFSFIVEMAHRALDEIPISEWLEDLSGADSKFNQRPPDPTCLRNTHFIPNYVELGVLAWWSYASSLLQSPVITRALRVLNQRATVTRTSFCLLGTRESSPHRLQHIFHRTSGVAPPPSCINYGSLRPGLA